MIIFWCSIRWQWKNLNFRAKIIFYFINDAPWRYCVSLKLVLKLSEKLFRHKKFFNRPSRSRDLEIFQWFPILTDKIQDEICLVSDTRNSSSNFFSSIFTARWHKEFVDLFKAYKIDQRWRSDRQWKTRQIDYKLRKYLFKTVSTFLTQNQKNYLKSCSCTKDTFEKGPFF